MTVRKKRDPVKQKRPVKTHDPDTADIIGDYLRNLYNTACAKTDSEISRKIEEAEKLISEGKKVDTRKLVSRINEEIILPVMVDEALEEHGASGHLILLPVSPISIELGRGLLSFLDPEKGAKLKVQCTSIRRQVAMEFGIVVPVMRFRDNLQLKPNAYVVKIREIEVATGEVMVNQFLAIGPEDKLKNLRGTKTVDPTYGRPGVWISPEQRGDAERLGCMTFDPVTVIATQLTEVVRTHAADLLGRQEVQDLIDTIEKTHPAVVRNFVPDRISLGEVQRVLQNLVRERVSVRDLVTVIETIADNVNMSKDPEVLTECVRVALSKMICKEYINNEGVINVITLDPQIEQIVAEAIQRTEMGSFLAIDPDMGQEILMSIGQEVGKLQERGLQPIILCAPKIRPALKRLTDRFFPSLVVLSWNEIAPKVNVNSVGMVRVDDLTVQAEKKEKIDVLALDIRLEKWLASFIIYNNNEYDIKLDEAAEEIFIRAIGKEFGNLESSKDSKRILCSSIISRVLRGTVWGSLLMETLKERFPEISFCVRGEPSGPSTSYNIVGTVSLD
ncbi:MAG: FHIPEP family type III secretion protein [Candidatus Xenobiia bacterium LiM19]